MLKINELSRSLDRGGGGSRDNDPPSIPAELNLGHLGIGDNLVKSRSLERMILDTKIKKKGFEMLTFFPTMTPMSSVGTVKSKISPEATSPCRESRSDWTF